MSKIIPTPLFEDIKEMHRVWHKFSGWLIKTYGSDLHGTWIKTTWVKEDASGRKRNLKYRSFNDLELSRRICGHEVIERIKRYVATHCTEINLVYCDDAYSSGSILLLIPHPAHGITVMFVPQATTIQNQFFLYNNHYKELIKVLKYMNNVYKKQPTKHAKNINTAKK